MMGFFKSLFGGNHKVDDPVLGALHRIGGQGAWSGQVMWEGYAAPTGLAVLRDDGPPTEGDRAAYLNLKRDWSALRLDLQGALWGLWTGPAQEFSAASALASSLDLWPQLQLQGINIAPSGDINLIFGFNSEVPTDGAFCVTLRGREVVEAVFEA
jgi:hypothetical protein